MFQFIVITSSTIISILFLSINVNKIYCLNNGSSVLCVAEELALTNQYTHCLSFVTQADCGPNEYLELAYENGSCPKCSMGLGLMCVGCDDLDTSKKCASGLRCQNSVCHLDKSKCAYTYHLSHMKQLPNCKLDGTFAAKQCKGDKLFGRCFCYNAEGKRIFGWDWWKNAVDNEMTCECSRLRDHLERMGRTDVTLHCAQNGNFEELQCDSNVCWCADRISGSVVIGTRAVPLHLWKFLPCYNRKRYATAKYLRQCESAAYAQKILRQAFKLRGNYDVSFNNLQCDYDGSYGTYLVENQIAACMWRDGQRISPFQANVNEATLMNCYCARDQRIFAEKGMNFPLACNGYGNYDKQQHLNGQSFCVDADGFAVTDYFNMSSSTTQQINCNQYLYYEFVPNEFDWKNCNQ